MKHKQLTFQRKALCQAIVLAGAMTAAGASVAVDITVNSTEIVTETITITASDNLTITSSGVIDITAAVFVAVRSATIYDGTITNNGEISITNDGWAKVGIQISSPLTGSIANNGDIYAGTVANSSAYGMYIGRIDGDGYVNNGVDGNIYASAGSSANGIFLAGSGGDLNGTLINEGLISALAPNNANGIAVFGSVNGKLINSGTIHASADSATGIRASGVSDSGSIINDGQIAVYGDSSAAGIHAGDISGSVINSSKITVAASSAVGIYADDISGGNITNSGTIDVSAGSAIGIHAGNVNNSGSVINKGIITIKGDGRAVGISAGGSGAVTNSATISAGLSSSGMGIGIMAFGDVTNKGTINASNYGVFVAGNVVNEVSGYIDADANHIGGNLNNSGEIYADNNYIGGDLDNSGLISGQMTVSGDVENSGIIDLSYTSQEGSYNYFYGDLNQTANGLLTFQVDDATNHAKLNVSGTATIDGTIGLNVTDDDLLFEGDVIEDLLTAGTLTSDDTLASEDNSLLWNFNVFKDGDTIDATVVRGILLEEIANSSEDTAFAEGVAALLDTWNDDMGGLTEEQVAIIGALNSEGDEEKLAQFLVQTTPTLAGQSPQALMSVATAIANVINNRVSATNAMKRGANSGDMNFDSRAFWVRPFYNDTEQKKREGLNSYDAEASGLVFGIDGAVNEDWRLGAAFSFGASSIDGTGLIAGQSLDSDTYQLSLYGNWTLEQSNFANFQLAIGQAQNETQRITALAGTSKAKYNSHFVQASAGYGQSFALNDNMSVTPSSSAVYTYINDKGYTETGGTAALDVAGRHTDSFELGVDAELAYNFAMGQYPAALTAHVGIAYDTLADSSQTSASFVAGGGSFITTGAKGDASTIRSGLGLQVFSDSAWDLSINYDVEIRKSFTAQIASVKVNYPF